MKQGWDIKKLGDICEFGNGLWTGKKPPFINVGVIRNTNFTKEGKLDDSDIVFLDVEQSQFVKRMLKYGDIILEKSGGGPKQPVGRVVIFDKEEGNYSFSNFTSLIRIKNFNQIDFNYLHLYLFFSYISGVTETMQSHSTGIRNLKFDEYKQISVPIPPLPEQLRIVGLLDEAFASIAKAKDNVEQNIKNARELFESYLQNVFEKKGDGWKIKKLSEVCEKITDGTHQTPKYYESGTIFLSSRNVTSGKINWDDIKYIDAKQHLEMQKRVAPHLNDILLAKNGTTGVAAIVDMDVVFDIYVSLALIRPLEVIIPEFMLYFLNSPVAKRQFNKRLKGMGVPNLHLEEIREVVITFPESQGEQKRIVKSLVALSSETKRLESIYQQKLSDLEELKKSLLQKAFNGELKVS